MNERLARVVQIVGVQFALLTASIHVWWGAPRALVYARARTLADPRPYLFLLSAAAIFAGVVALAAGYAPRRLYALGTLVMAAYTVSYVWWHLGGHGGAIPGVAGYGHPQLSNLDTLLSPDHLFRPLDALSMVSQVVAGVCFTALWWRGGPSRDTSPAVSMEEP